MIVQCRPSVYRKVIVVWLGNVETFGYRKCIVKCRKEYEFDTFADANGFASGLVKRRIKVMEIYYA